MASKNAFIENITKRKVSYKKRQKTFLNKANELSIIGDVEMAIIINSPYHDEPKVFPNHDAAINTFTKFRDLPASEKSKDIKTQEMVTKKRIKKMEQQLENARRKNEVNEFTNKMYEMLNEKDIPTNIHLYDLNDLSYVINQSLKQVHETIKMKVEGEGSTSNATQSIAGMMVPSKTSSEARVEAPVPMIPLPVPLTMANGTNSEGPRAPLFVPDMAPISVVSMAAPLLVPSATSTQVPQPMFHMTTPLMTFSETDPLVDTSRIYPSPNPLVSFSSQIFPPMVPQMYPPTNLQMDLQRPPGMAPSITMASPMSLPMMTSSISAPVFPPTTSQVDPSINFPPVDALMSTNYSQNYYAGISNSPVFSETLDWPGYDITTLIDESFFNNINVQDPNNKNNI